jgi:hypothetical protein
MSTYLEINGCLHHIVATSFAELKRQIRELIAQEQD